jgi:hypothetical protein
LAIYSHPKYFEKGYKSLFTAAPHLLAGKRTQEEEEGGTEAGETWQRQSPEEEEEEES